MENNEEKILDENGNNIKVNNKPKFIIIIKKIYRLFSTRFLTNVLLLSSLIVLINIACTNDKIYSIMPTASDFSSSSSSDYFDELRSIANTLDYIKTIVSNIEDTTRSIYYRF